MSKEIIQVQDVTKLFLIPNEKVDTIKGLFLNPFRKISKEEFKALDNVSLSIEQGDFIGIIGTNGSGKSTLMKLIAGIYEPTSGQISVQGNIIPFLELGVGFNVELSGRENIFLNGTILGMKRSFLEERFDKIIEFAGIEDFVDLPVKNYSSGMIVRLAFAIAIQTEADIYLLDEVFAVGDAHFQRKSIKVMKELVERNKTILFVSHSLDQIDKFANKVLWLDKGKIKYFGDKDIALKAYQNQILDVENYQRQLELEKIQEEQAQEEVEQVITKVGSFEVSIKKVEVNVDREKQLAVKVHLNHQKAVENLNVAFGIYKDTGENVFSFSTKASKYSLAKNANSVSANVDVSKLITGEYFINVAVFGKDEQNPYHWEKALALFRIDQDVRNKGYRGVVTLDYNWSHQ